MILKARRSTCTITAAVFDTLGAPLRTDKVWECEAVFGDVGSDAVLADAVVGESFCRAVIFTCFKSLVADLKADTKA